MESIPDFAFYECNTISSITVQAVNPPTLGNNVFYNVNKNIPVTVPCGSANAYRNAAGWGEFTNIIDASYEISTGVNPSEGGTTTGAGAYCSGSNCTLTATANSGYLFSNWTENGMVVSSDANYSFTVTGDRNLVANFEIGHTITASANPGIGGSVTGTEVFCHGTTATLTAMPNNSYDFVSWTKNGAIVSNEACYSFTVTEIADYVANFTWASPSGVDYVTDGLIMYVDGIYNTRNGHSTTTNVWEDLAGNYDLVVSEYDSYSWEDDHFIGHGNAGYLNTGHTWQYFNSLTNDLTIEVVTYIDCDKTSPAWRGLAGWHLDEYGTNFQNDQGGNRMESLGCIPVTDVDDKIVTVSYTRLNGSFLNGEWKVRDHRLLCGVNSSLGVVFGNSFQSNGVGQRGWNDSIYCIRMYNRSLTPEEVAHNHSIDMERFGAGSNNSSMLNGLFSVSDSVQVRFSQGNLQYQASTNTWRFVENQWDYIGTQSPDNNGNTGGTVSSSDNNNISQYYDGWIDLFCWGASGYNHGAVCYQPWSTNRTYSDYYAYGSSTYNLYDQTGQADWGYNAISNGGNVENIGWRTLTREEWMYLFDTRNTASGVRYAKACVNGVNGVILLPDDWRSDYYSFNDFNSSNASFSSNVINSFVWQSCLEVHGAAFLPNAGSRNGMNVSEYSIGIYWASSKYSYALVYDVFFQEIKIGLGASTRDNGYSVRLVCSPRIITTSSNSDEYGTVSGGGCFAAGKAITLTATANPGYTFVNWTKNGEVVSTDATYSFTVVESGNYVANFSEAPSTFTQASEFANGWNWWSSYVEADDLMAQLKTGLGADGKQIKSQTKFTMNYGSMWMGQLNSIENDQTYMVQALAPCSVDVTGFAVDPADYPITLNTGWKWIGFPSSVTLTVTEALAGITPSAGDQIKAQSSFSTYYNNIGWMGTLKNLTPGKGYMFKLNGASQTLVFPSGSRKMEVEKNITSDGNHWVPDIYAYPSNMTVLAVVELDDIELASDNYELAAFADGECRGSGRLMYVEGLNRYMAFLTIAGDEAAELRFGLYDDLTDTECFDSGDVLVYAADAIVGTPDAPMVVRFRGTTGLSDIEHNLHVYPNPANGGERFSVSVPAGNNVRVEVVNALGVVVETYQGASAPASVTAPMTAGVYTLRITVDGKGTYSRKLVVK